MGAGLFGRPIDRRRFLIGGAIGTGALALKTFQPLWALARLVS